MGGGGAAVLMLLLLLMGAKALCLESSTLACPEGQADDCGTLVLRHYPKLELSILGLTAEAYSAFIARLRESLGSSSDIWTIPVLRSRDSVPLSQRFVLLDITNTQGETATLAIDVTNVYLVGYRVGGDSFFITPDNDDTRDAIRHLFPGTERHELPFTGGYAALEVAAGNVNRENISLGAGALDTSVTSLIRHATYPSPTLLHSVAHGLIVCIQMISEAARFRYVEFEMKSRIRRYVNSGPDPSVTYIVNTWDSMSRAIQRSSSDGVFEGPILLQRRNYSRLEVFNVQSVIPLLSLMAFYCNPPSSPKQGLHHHHPPAVIRLVTAGLTCPAHVQSTLQILGADGLCADVRDGHYNNGNPIQLWPCRSSNNRNQLWTFMADGTLRSNGKCLASYGYTPGDYIMIYDCRPGVAAFTWHAWPNGTISSASGLVLSTNSSAKGTTLTARHNAFAPGQSWLVTNTTDPSVHKIAGVSGLYCLHANGSDAVLQECARASSWVLYPDSTIRPDQRRNFCLASPGTHLLNLRLNIVSCNPNAALQRWLFANDGTIVSFSTDLVIDVMRGSGVSGAHLTLNYPSGKATQEWQPLL